ncbi:MOS1T transposase, partial [Pseudoatta argentina]
MIDGAFFISHPMFHKKNLELVVNFLLVNDYPLKFIFDTIHNRIKHLINKKMYINYDKDCQDKPSCSPRLPFWPPNSPDLNPLDYYVSLRTAIEAAKILQVDESTVSKRLKGLGMIQKQGHWVPYELKPRDVERRFGTCELLLQRQKRKDFLHRIVTGDEKRIHYDNPKRRKSWGKPGHAQRHDKVILLHDNARPHVAKPVKTYLQTLKWEVLPHPPTFFRKIVEEAYIVKNILYTKILCLNICFKYFKSSYYQIVSSLRAVENRGVSPAMHPEKRPLYAQRRDKVILLHDNARPHVAKPVKTYLETLKWEVVPHPPYSPDIALSDFHLFRLMAHGLADRRFRSYEEAQKWIDSWIASKDMSFFRRGIHVLAERWSKVVGSDAKYFINVFFNAHVK